MSYNDERMSNVPLLGIYFFVGKQDVQRVAQTLKNPPSITPKKYKV